jgi:hypothetical protein
MRSGSCVPATASRGPSSGKFTRRQRASSGGGGLDCSQEQRRAVQEEGSEGGGRPCGGSALRLHESGI